MSSRREFLTALAVALPGAKLLGTRLEPSVFTASVANQTNPGQHFLGGTFFTNTDKTKLYRVMQSGPRGWPRNAMLHDAKTLKPVGISVGVVSPYHWGTVQVQGPCYLPNR